ncbi:electron transfer flavoprotein subunit alpha/FixB family protein [Adlercreutzia sp. ZJ154]|uniref:electron transfer flavoprotein subunit alpha/FixB family protein n=1 Tax=Adlercreutzia sp. ZJ154 TaxID=2709790 RepID=UPI0013EBB763|nr:electron transfer flavoprotein subunit alpha/FixB family protein [Adlercreutzia sp. ZJ154]
MIDKSWVIVTDLRRAGGMLAAAQSAGTEPIAIVIGDENLAQRVIPMGFSHAELFITPEKVPPEALAPDVARKALIEKPRLVLGNDSPSTRVILGHISGAIDSSVLSAVQRISREGDDIVAECQIANGKAIETIKVSGAITLIFNGPDKEVNIATEANIETIKSEGTGDKVIENNRSGKTGLSTADCIVGVGMGLRSKDDLAIIEELARALEGEVACTLPVSDSVHWCSSDRVLGSSHNTAAPELYFAIGISGSPNHTSGVRDAKVVVAINNDPDAEIFRFSKYGIVGDLYEVVPVITSALT